MIKHAAIITKCGTIIKGKCHADCFKEGNELGLELLSAADNQGFLDNEGKFYRRKEAAEIAFICGQIDKKTKILLSEDLWCEQYEGKHDYDKDRGYYLKGAER